MNATALRRASTVDQLTAVLRERILDGDLEPGQRLIERELVEAYEVARHTLRAALRQLEVEGLVRVEPNRGARVAAAVGRRADRALRAAPGARARGRPPRPGARRRPAARRGARGGAAPAAPRAATALDLERDLPRPQRASTPGSSRPAGAPRIERAYAALSTEIALFVSQLKPVWTKEQVGADHVALVRAIEREGPDVLREHMAQALRALRPGA